MTTEWAGAEAWEAWAAGLKPQDRCIAYGTNAVVLKVGRERCLVLPDRPGTERMWVDWEDLRPPETK